MYSAELVVTELVREKERTKPVVLNASTKIPKNRNIDCTKLSLDIEKLKTGK